MRFLHNLHNLIQIHRMDIDANANADIKCEQSNKATSYFIYCFLMLKWLSVIYAKDEVMSHQYDYSLLDVSLIEEFHTLSVKILIEEFHALSVKILMCLSVTS